MQANEGNEEFLDRVAEAITDGVPVDWPAPETPRLDFGTRIAQLRAIETIARAHQEFAARLFVSGVGDATPSNLGDATLPVDLPARLPLFEWGPLEVLEKLGSGSFGEVYRAYDSALAREVALKLLRIEPDMTPAAEHHFLAEARRLARIRHENVVVIHGADVHDGRPGMWMDLLRGETLADLVAERGPFGSQEAAVVGAALCRALAALHTINLMHRDLKPANVMREQGGRIVLFDFGCAVETDLSPRQRAAIAGTPVTMAPEVLLQTTPASFTADIYSLGVLLYWLVSGKYPVEASTLEGFLECHRRGDWVPLRSLRPDLPSNFVQIVERAGARQPQDRYPSMGDMERDLMRHVGALVQASLTLEGTAPSVQPTKPRPGSRRRRSVIVPAVVTVAVALAVVGIFVRARFAPLRAEAALYRQAGDASEIVASDSAIHSGDHLYLEIEGSKPMCVYVLYQDAAGKHFLLQSPAGANVLAAHVRHRLPAEAAAGTSPRSWIVTSGGGTETIAVIAAPHRLPQLESEIQDYVRVDTGRSAAVHSRGIGGVVDEVGRPLLDVARYYATDAWVWSRQLRNDSP